MEAYHHKEGSAETGGSLLVKMLLHVPLILKSNIKTVMVHTIRPLGCNQTECIRLTNKKDPCAYYTQTDQHSLFVLHTEGRALCAILVRTEGIVSLTKKMKKNFTHLLMIKNGR